MAQNILGPESDKKHVFIKNALHSAVKILN